MGQHDSAFDWASSVGVEQVSRPQRVAVTGFYGMSNFGDDLFCSALNQEFDSRLPNWRVTFVAPPLRDVNARFLLPAWYPVERFQQSSRVGAASRLVAGAVAWLGSDVVVLGGGSILSSVTGVRRMQVALDRVHSPRKVAMGVSVGPFASAEAEAAVRDFLASFSFVALRDARSYGLVREFALPGRFVLSGDLAALAAAPVRRPQSEIDTSGAGDGFELGLVPCSFKGFDEVGYLRGLRAVAGWARRVHAVHITVFSLNNHPVVGDDALCARTVATLASLGASVRLVRYGDRGIEGTWAELSRLSGVISTRLHGSVAAYLSGVPMALIEYHQKCTDFCDDIGQDSRLRLQAAPTPAAIESVLDALYERRVPAVTPQRYRENTAQALSDFERSWL